MSTAHFPVLLQTERLRLALLGPEHAEAVAAYFQRNREYMQPWNPRVDPDFFSALWQAQRLENDQSEYAAGRMARFWMFRREDTQLGEVIGHIALSNIIRGALQGCHLGYMIDAAAGGQGLMTEGCRAVIAFGFTELGLHRIEANIMPHNAPSLRVIEKLGFSREGFSPRYLRINGEWADHYRYGLINE